MIKPPRGRDEWSLERPYAAIPAIEVTTKASPPPRGVGVECELRSLGMSMRPTWLDRFRIIAVSSAEMTRSIPAVETYGITNGPPKQISP